MTWFLNTGKGTIVHLKSNVQRHKTDSHHPVMSYA